MSSGLGETKFVMLCWLLVEYLGMIATPHDFIGLHVRGKAYLVRDHNLPWHKSSVFSSLL